MKTYLISARIPESLYLWLKKLIKKNNSTLTAEIVNVLDKAKK